MTYDVAIVGAGMAGLTCAVELKRQGVNSVVVDAAVDVGGRIRTDEQDGFLLDRGFQVLLTGYQQTRRLLNFDDLRLAPFHSGALVRTDGHFARVGDPTRHPQDLLPTVFSRVGTLWDKLAVVRLRQSVCGPPLATVLARPDVSTEQRLHELGFSSSMIGQFFRPFLGGIFLETDLVTSSRKFEFVFRTFAEGVAAIPRDGIRALPKQLAARLPDGQVRLSETVTKVTGSGVELVSGETIAARQVVIATDVWAATQLIDQPVTTTDATVACVYFAARRPPVAGSWLVLNGEGFGPINNLTVPSNLQASYAPPGQSLVSVTVLKPAYLEREDLVACVLAQLSEWYGPETKHWKHLRTYRIARAVPVQRAGDLTPVAKPSRVNHSIVRCGDYADIVSIEGAVQSGLQAAQEVLARLS